MVRKIVVEAIDEEVIARAIAASIVPPAVATLTKAIYGHPMVKAASAVRRLARRVRDACGVRRAPRVHIRAGLSRAPRRRTASASIRRATADTGGDGDPEPPEPRARGPPVRA
jgi:hypothetical protein